MKKIYVLKFEPGNFHEIFLPIFWFGLKRYYELNGKYSNDWTWIPPVVDYSNMTFEDICNEAIAHKADVYAFSSYVWNWNLVLAVSKKIREELPNSIIVLGGPNQNTTYTDPINWFRKYPQFDATCRPTEYGEFFITDLLDSIIEGDLNWGEIRNSYYRKGFGPLGDKRSFIFPEDAIAQHLDIALEYTTLAKNKNKKSMLLYETTRGCPFACTYCEWGGGINSKINAKSIDTIKKELEYLAVLDVSVVYLCDANFGILPRDEEVAKLFALYKKLGAPFNIGLSGLAKTSVDKRFKVLEPLFESGVINRYQMSVQTTSPQSLDAIHRTDISLEENMKLGYYFKEKYNAHVAVEIILGLPETTIEDFYKELDYFFVDYSPIKYFITVLPDSPYSDPQYIKKYGLVLSPVGLESVDWVEDEYFCMYDTEIIKEPFTYMTVASNTFSKEDWKEMAFMSDMEMIFINKHMLKPFTDYMIKNKNYKPSFLLKKIYSAISSVEEFYQPIDEYLTKITEGKYANSDYKKINGHHVYKFYLEQWVKHRKKIFESIRSELKNELDSVSLDCLNYVENSTLREEGSICFNVNYDWKEWEENERRGSEPYARLLTVKTEARTIIWHNMIKRTDHSEGFNLPDYDYAIINKKSTNN